MRFTRRISAVALLLAAVASGCGAEDGSRALPGKRDVGAAYGREVGETLESVEAALTEIGGEGDLSDDLEQAASAIEEAAGRLDRIDPPDEVETEHAILVAGERSLADELRVLARFLEEAREGDLRSLDGAIELLAGARLDGAREIREARERLAQKGYELEPDGAPPP